MLILSVLNRLQTTPLTKFSRTACDHRRKSNFLFLAYSQCLWISYRDVILKVIRLSGYPIHWRGQISYFPSPSSEYGEEVFRQSEKSSFRHRTPVLQCGVNILCLSRDSPCNVAGGVYIDISKPAKVERGEGGGVRCRVWGSVSQNQFP